MALFGFGVNLLLLWAIWRFILRPAVLDHYRDALFDLRDRVRCTYIDSNLDMNSPVYRNLRSLINGYLRYTEHFSLPHFLLIERRLRKDGKLRESISRQVGQDFVQGNAAEQAYAASVRHDAVYIMQRYMIASSGPMVILTTIALPVIICNAIGSFLLDTVARSVTLSTKAAMRKFSEVTLSWQKNFGPIVMDNDFIEACAYQESDRVSRPRYAS